LTYVKTETGQRSSGGVTITPHIYGGSLVGSQQVDYKW